MTRERARRITWGMPDPIVTLFAFDWSKDALVFAGPNGAPMGITVAALRHLGWHATSEGFRAALPRFDVSPLAVKPVNGRAKAPGR